MTKKAPDELICRDVAKALLGDSYAANIAPLKDAVRKFALRQRVDFRTAAAALAESARLQGENDIVVGLFIAAGWELSSGEKAAAKSGGAEGGSDG